MPVSPAPEPCVCDCGNPAEREYEGDHYCGPCLAKDLMDLAGLGLVDLSSWDGCPVEDCCGAHEPASAWSKGQKPPRQFQPGLLAWESVMPLWMFWCNYHHWEAMSQRTGWPITRPKGWSWPQDVEYG